jgi:hypothetical protein
MEESLMSNDQSYERQPGRLPSPGTLLRLSSILFFLLMVGHMSAYPWTSTRGLQQAQLARSMQSVDFVFFGERSTYWSLYFGWGLLIAVLLLTIAGVLWVLADLVLLSPRRLGTITGILSASCLIGSFLSFRFFYIPPFLFFAALCAILLTTSVQLLKQRA